MLLLKEGQLACPAWSRTVASWTSLFPLKQYSTVLSEDLTSPPEGRSSISFFFVSLVLAQGLVHDLGK